jgi:hypothetical protein
MPRREVRRVMRRTPATFGILLVLLAFCVHHFHRETAALDSCKLLREAIRKQDQLTNDAAVDSVITALGPLDRGKCLELAVRRPLLDLLSTAERDVYATINACVAKRAKRASVELFGYATSAQCAAFRIVFGIDPAIPGRDPICIANDLLPECAYDKERNNVTTIFIHDYVDPSKGPFFLDWSAASRRCFVVWEKPTGRLISGGGPFQTFSEAISATQTVKGCEDKH